MTKQLTIHQALERASKMKNVDAADQAEPKMNIEDDVKDLKNMMEILTSIVQKQQKEIQLLNLQLECIAGTKKSKAKQH